MKTRKFASEIYWPLAKRTHTHTPENITICILHENMFWKFPRRYNLIWIYVPDFVFWKNNKWIKVQLPKWIRDRSIHSLFKPKYDSWLFVNFCVFTPSYLFLPGVNLKLFWKSKQVRMGKNTDINKQSGVKFWFNWRKHGAMSYSFSCKYK